MSATFSAFGSTLSLGNLGTKNHITQYSFSRSASRNKHFLILQSVQNCIKIYKKMHITLEITFQLVINSCSPTMKIALAVSSNRSLTTPKAKG